ncbi:hypothetical protein FB451DRAFT_1170707 [Mycena latifolia]|nr:hypothetical protein FB451DRAFT_1170707 [Mycena latifolia]
MSAPCLWCGNPVHGQRAIALAVKLIAVPPINVISILGLDEGGASKSLPLHRCARLRRCGAGVLQATNSTLALRTLDSDSPPSSARPFAPSRVALPHATCTETLVNLREVVCVRLVVSRLHCVQVGTHLAQAGVREHARNWCASPPSSTLHPSCALRVLAVPPAWIMSVEVLSTQCTLLFLLKHRGVRNVSLGMDMGKNDVDAVAAIWAMTLLQTEEEALINFPEKSG